MNILKKIEQVVVNANVRAKEREEWAKHKLYIAQQEAKILDQEILMHQQEDKDELR